MAWQMWVRIIIAVAATLAATVAVISAFSTSLSVGGATYSLDSEACTSCHYEVPYYRGWKKSFHGEADVTCLDCHKTAVIKDDACLKCHEDYDITNITSYLWDWAGVITVIDSHAKRPHIGSVPCVSCHIEHEFRMGTPRPVTKTICRLCHPPYIP